jgi:hypothetical protein
MVIFVAIGPQRYGAAVGGLYKNERPTLCFKNGKNWGAKCAKKQHPMGSVFLNPNYRK